MTSRGFGNDDASSHDTLRVEVTSNNSNDESDSAFSVTSSKTASRWAILRRAIVSNSNSTTTADNKNSSSAMEGSIHQFRGFNFLRRQRLAKSQVKLWKEKCMNIRLSPVVDNSTAVFCNELIDNLEASLLALTALLPHNWDWEFNIMGASSSTSTSITASLLPGILKVTEERLQHSCNTLRLVHEKCHWIESSPKTERDGEQQVARLKIVLAPFVPSHGLYHYTLPDFTESSNATESPTAAANGKLATNCNSHNSIVTRERLPTSTTTTLSLEELTCHHRNQGVDNTGNICVWDSESTLSYCLLQRLALGTLFHPGVLQGTRHTDDNTLEILELGSGMAGLAGLALAQRLQCPSSTGALSQKIRVWLTDGHPQAVQNNRVHTHLMQLQHLAQQTTRMNLIKCQVLKWSMEDPYNTDPLLPQSLSPAQPPPCHLAIVSDCTHFQEFHAHLFFTLAFGLQVQGYAYLCQPHRGKSLTRFLSLVNVCQNLFSTEWLQVDEVEEAAKEASERPYFDANLHRPYLIRLCKLREVTNEDRSLVLAHMDARDQVR